MRRLRQDWSRAVRWCRRSASEQVPCPSLARASVCLSIFLPSSLSFSISLRDSLLPPLSLLPALSQLSRTVERARAEGASLLFFSQLGVSFRPLPPHLSRAPPPYLHHPNHSCTTEEVASHFSAQNCANVLWAFATMGIEPSPRVAQALLDR